MCISTETSPLLGTCNFIRGDCHQPKQDTKNNRVAHTLEYTLSPTILGLASYYRRFIRRFASIARPLHRLTERGRPFKWTMECDTAFAQLKTMFTIQSYSSLPKFFLTIYFGHRCLPIWHRRCLITKARGW